MATDCYECGDSGHFARDCPNTSLNGTAVWCGFCDERTRLIDSGNAVRRCQQCHPLRRNLLAGHRRCPSCHATVLSWDHAECGAHAIPPARELLGHGGTP